MAKQYETCGKVRVGVGQNNMGVWLWSIEVDMGEVYADDDETGTRYARPDEDVRDEDKVWRTLASGKEPVESFAWIAAGGAAVGLSLVATTLVGRVAEHAGGAAGILREFVKDLTPTMLEEDTTC